MRDRPRDDEPPDQPPESGRPSEGDRPERRTDQPGKAERPYEMSKEFQPDRKKLTPIQRDFARKMADSPPEPASADTPYLISFKTGESLDHEKPPPDLGDDADGADEFGDVGGVHDPLDATRPKDQTGGLQGFIDERDQAALEHTIAKDADGNFEKFPDPDGEWTDYVNDGGPDIDHFRGNNCLDCSVAALATWHGHPTVAAPRFPDVKADGIDFRTGERGGPNRAEQWLEARYEGFEPGDAGLAGIEQRLRDGGHGSAAAIVTSWNPKFGSGSHAWNAFNHNGEIVWYDPQQALTDDRPVYGEPLVRSVAAICIDSEGRQL